MKITLCNEVLQPMSFAEQCVYAAALGYDGLEVAPFTLSDEPHRLSDSERAALRRAASDAGIAVSGLHWLLLTPKGLSVTSSDDATLAHTIDVLRRLIDLCAELGGRVLVHGSPAQRRIPDGESRATALARLQACLAVVAEHAAQAGVIYCIEPLAPPEAQLINTLAEAAALVDAIDQPSLRTMIDCSAAGRAEAEPIAALIDRWLPTGRIAHVQVNDANRQGPGRGEERFAPIIAALARNAYAGVIAVEPFKYVPDGPAAAARAVGYLRGLIEALPA